jgi:hypothetical protein
MYACVLADNSGDSQPTYRLSDASPITLGINVDVADSDLQGSNMAE